MSGGIWGDITDLAGKAWHAVTGTPSESEKRAQQAAITNQVNFYKQQTEIANSEIANKRAEQIAEKRRINEKQIRSLRRHFSPSGFLDSSIDAPDKLGA